MGKSANGFVDAVIGGWTLGSIITAFSGLPYSIVTSGNPANTGTINIVNRPDVVGDPYEAERTIQADFNTAAFRANQPFAIGNAGRNIMSQRTTSSGISPHRRTGSYTKGCACSFDSRHSSSRTRRDSEYQATPSEPPTSESLPALIRRANRQFGLKLLR